VAAEGASVARAIQVVKQELPGSAKCGMRYMHAKPKANCFAGMKLGQSCQDD
jgi:hypothetical protein